MQAADLERGAFSDVGPWLVPSEAMEWQHGIGELRIRVAAQVPELVKRRKIPPISRALVTAWHLGKALLGWKFIDQRRNPETARAGLVAATPRRLLEARPDLHQARPDPLVR